MDKTKIEWADATWNPVIGCEQKSPGCANCYAKRLAETRFGLDFGIPTYKPHLDLKPLQWQRPRVIFVNSLSDLFWSKIDQGNRDRWFAVMLLAHWHTFMVLTKDHLAMKSYLNDPDTPKRVAELALTIYRNRHKRLGDLPQNTRWPLPNVRIGVSAENKHWWNQRVPVLQQTRAAYRFVSAEPLLGLIEPDRASLAGINLVIGGGESGPRARPTFPRWARALRDGVLAAGVMFDWKQWGEFGPATVVVPNDKPGWSFVYPTGDTNGIPGHGPVYLMPNSKIIQALPNDGVVARYGKKIAGRLLDGQLWDYRGKR